MRTLVVAALLVGAAFIWQMRPSPSQRWFGVITEIEPGQWIRVSNEMTDWHGMKLALTRTTRVDGDPRGLRLAARVQIIYAHTGGGSVARHVTVLPDETPPSAR